jgi:hypothetical protein
MKCWYCFLLALLVAACGQQDHQAQLQTEIDSLQQKLDDSYKPGFGEFMSGIQMHHAKLWFAGTNNNWPLAEFEMKEIREALDDVRKYNTDRPETSNLGLIDPAMDSLDHAIQAHNPTYFRNSFQLLTNSCNECHRETNHAFNVITLPLSSPVSNQRFDLPQQ